MPVSPTYPGVYVQEVPSGVRTIVGVSTSTALFVGSTLTGPLLRAVRLSTYTDFVRTFGDDGGTVSQMARYVRLFFQNGGTDCYVIRIANNAKTAATDLEAEDGTKVLRLEAKNAGTLGNNLRVAVDYNTASPESTFNMTVFRWDVKPGGIKSVAESETFLNLSMDKDAPNYAVTSLNQKSKLVNATPGTVTAGVGASMSTLPVPAAAIANLVTSVNGMLATGRSFKITIGRNPTLVISAPNMAAAGTFAATRQGWADAIGTLIQNQVTAQNFTGVGTPAVNVTGVQGPAMTGGESTLLRFVANGNYDVRIESADSDDLAVQLALGPANNGLEVGSFAAARPAPTGVTFLADQGLDGTINAANTPWFAFATTTRNTFTGITLDEINAAGALVAKPFAWTLPNGATSIWQDSAGGNTGVLEVLGFVRDQINNYAAANPTSFFWKAAIWGQRLAIIDASGDDNAMVTGGLQTVPAAMANLFNENVRYYSVGPNATAGSQAVVRAGSNGTAPKQSDYNDAYAVAKSDIDLFNLLVLPPDASPAIALEKLWADASAVCAEERAFLIMDPPDAWTDTQSASTGVNALRPGLVKDYSAVYFPRLKLVENGREFVVGPAGAVAGLYARIDSSRGVWKAPAGTEADLRGVTGIDLNMSDLQNGQINPVGVNAVRLFPEGIVSWGARTMDGADAFASEYKYVPIRRLALFMEESLYRGLKWVVFEPNDEPLWAQIRLNVGAFMHDLFRKGAFQGTTPNQAYFVKCDKETTTANDQNLGIVNIWVGFAPLKPAEFVVLYLQQIAQQPS